MASCTGTGHLKVAACPAILNVTTQGNDADLIPVAALSLALTAPRAMQATRCVGATPQSRTLPIPLLDLAQLLRLDHVVTVNQSGVVWILHHKRLQVENKYCWSLSALQHYSDSRYVTQIPLLPTFTA